MSKSYNFSGPFARLALAVGAKSQKDLAEQLGVSPPVVANWIKRGTMPYEHFVKVARETGHSLDWLILGRGDQLNPVPAELRCALDQLLVVYARYRGEA